MFWVQLQDDLFKSILYSFNQIELSDSQRIGVATLIHKGKELSREELSNWGPITVTNTDYKIIADAISE